MAAVSGLDAGLARLASNAHRMRSAVNRPPGWPLAVLFVGFPIWWLLGLSQLICLVIAGVMCWELLRRRHVLVPSGFGIWLLFLAWTITGPLVAQVAAPGTVPTVQLSRYFTWLYHVSFLLVGTIALVYLATVRPSAARVGRILASMFVVVVAGGLLGVLAPHLSFPSLVELGLPHRLDANEFIHAQVHPVPAELQDYLGDRRARPSAPFAYSNAWGLSYALLVPFFVSSWLRKDAGWRRPAAPFVLLASLVPVVYSLNRGLWGALVVALLFLAVRGVVTGRLWLIASVLTVACVVAAMLYGTALGSKIDARLNGHNSNEGRTNLSSLAVSSAAEGSPVVGFGTTRRVQGSFHSIAQGSTPQCRLCAPPALGTQGQLWTVTFSFGLVGAALFLSFFCYHFFRRIASRSPEDTTCLTVLLVYLVTLPIYDFSYPGMIAVMGAVSLLDRRGSSAHARTLAACTAQVRAHWRVVVACVLLGGLGGAASQLLVGRSYQGTASVEIPLGAILPGQHTEQVTLDEVAQEVAGTDVTTAVARALDVTPTYAAQHLVVTATPTSRILHLTYAAGTRSDAETGARTAVTALLDRRGRDLVAARDRELRALNRELASAAPGRNGQVSDQVARVQEDLVRTETTDVTPGTALGPPVVKRLRDGWPVWTTSGAALGLLVGTALVCWVAPWRRLRSLRRDHVIEGTRVALHLSADTLRSSSLPRDARQALERVGADTYVAVGHDRVAARVANLLDRHVGGAEQRDAARSVILVGTTDTRRRQVSADTRRLHACSIRVAGLALVSQTSSDDLVEPDQLVLSDAVPTKESMR
jgi:hypothetical protein